jgi:hypothetical protein
MEPSPEPFAAGVTTPASELSTAVRIPLIVADSTRAWLWGGDVTGGTTMGCATEGSSTRAWLESAAFGIPELLATELALVF